MIVTTPKRGRVAAALIAAVAAFAISITPSHSAQGAPSASKVPMALCGGAGTCA